MSLMPYAGEMPHADEPGEESRRARDPTGIFEHSPTGIYEHAPVRAPESRVHHEHHQETVNRVTFRAVADEVADDGSFVDVKQREVTFVGDEQLDSELPSGSRISLAAHDQTLPMAFDNQRFFEGEDGYQDLISEAFANMERSGNTWGEPTKEMGLFGWTWRWCVKFLMWMTNDPINRLRFTRGVQGILPFLTGYESFALSGVVRTYDVDEREMDDFNLSLGFKNRNVSRIIIQGLRRWDWFFHSSTSVTWSRPFDLFGVLPMIGVTRFPGTENFPASRNQAVGALFRLLFEGSWLTRFTTGLQGTVTFDPDTAAQNLAAEGIGFEAANRNQFGTSFGREKTNEFRIEHRLATDESISRTFFGSPASTLVNNGVEHVLRCLAKHWRNMLYQENGNFAHQRMEQLSPFETLRFHMPTVLTTLANLRGRNVWDMKVLGPFMKKLQRLNADKIKRYNHDDVEAANDEYGAEVYGPCQAAQGIVRELKDKIIPNVCGGVPSRMDPLSRWADAIFDSLTELSKEAEVVKQFIATVDPGIKLGYQLLKLVDWRVPSEARIKRAVTDFILDKLKTYSDVPREVINTALQKLPAKEERTLRELLRQGLAHVEAAQLLLGRTGTLLERELRRKAIDDRIHQLSKGPATTSDKLEKNKWYWIDMDMGSRVFVFKSAVGSHLKVIDVVTNVEQLIETGQAQSIRRYIPVAEAISRAQKAFMVIEIDHGKKFSYNSFMEFGSTSSSTSIRTRLRRLVTIAQLQCPALDLARSNVLSEVKSSVQQMRSSPNFRPTCTPQNVTVFGGGPTGLLGAIHCLHNVILSGGEVKVYEGRDAFDQEGSSFERAQIVRLDPRQISMLRYHLGTGYEDVYIPGKGETDPHHGNSLPLQGFVEVTIKRLESMILDEIVNLRSRDLMQYYTDSKINYDAVAGTFEKEGKFLKVEDRFVNDAEVMQVRDFVFPSRVLANDLIEGKDYDITLPREKKVRSFRLIQMDTGFDWYQFSAHEPGVKDVSGSFRALPPIYLSGQGRVAPNSVIVDVNGSKREIPFDAIKDKKFRMDFTSTHVVVALGKPENSPTHFYVTTKEPYAVCCIEGIKISMGMHNFGEKRWGAGFLDDFRSLTDQNTRVIGDFTKSVALRPVVERMRRKVTKDPVWKVHLEQLAESLNDKAPSLHALVLGEVEALCGLTFRRTRLQTRFFELGNNYYLGMEFPREYDEWKIAAIQQVAPSKLETAPDAGKSARTTLQKTLANHIDRLWYEACLEIIAEGDVYNPGGRGKIPQLYTIDSPFEQRLGELNNLEAFRLFTKKYRVHKHDGNGFTQIQSDHERETFGLPTKTYVIELATKVRKLLSELAAGDLFEPVDTFEIVEKRRYSTVVRNSGGHVCVMSNKVRVGRASDLARGPSGYSESRVALASFPVAHVVSHRTLQVNRVKGKGGDDGFITAYVGDAQASPHFMRYSGLTGACINCMTINNLVAQALQGVSYDDRIQRYSFETNWSNGEVVQRGTGANYGQDGFLRPGFPYRKLVDYLYGRVTEHYEIKADIESVLTRDWKIKIAAAIVPRGLETDGLFYESLLAELVVALRGKYEDEVKRVIGKRELPVAVAAAVSSEMDSIASNHYNATAALSPQNEIEASEARVVKLTGLLLNAVLTALRQAIDYSVELRQENNRISSELFNQPNAVDTIVDDFAVEAQNFANALTQSAAFTSTVIALRLGNAGDGSGAAIAAAVLGAWNLLVSFGSITNVSRYKNRNEEMRRKIFDEKLDGVMKAVFSLMTRDQRDRYVQSDNPFVRCLDVLVEHFIASARYYNMPEGKISSFETAYNRYKGSSKDQSSTLFFMRQLVRDFIAGTFQENSYLQEELVNIYKSMDEMLKLAKQAPSNGTTGADQLYMTLLNFKPKLARSIQRGNIKYGFVRSSSWWQTPVPVSIKFVLSPFLYQRTIAGKTRAILKAAEAMQVPGVVNKTLSRPIRDLSELFYATKESEVSSAMILSASFVFTINLFFTIVRLCELNGNVDANGRSTRYWVRAVLAGTSWATLATLSGTGIAIFHYLRKLRHLCTLDFALAAMKADPRIRRVRAIARTQALLVVVRLGAVTAAAVALPWAIAQAMYGSRIAISGDYPFSIAVGAVSATLFAVLFFFCVEFVVRYNLDPRLGRTVCEPFRARIEQIKQSYTITDDSLEIETTQKLEKEAWEYTARQFLHEYRFDTVFGADRLGSILQHLQSGNKMHDE